MRRITPLPRRNALWNAAVLATAFAAASLAGAPEGGVRPAIAQPPNAFTDPYPSPASLRECRAAPARFGAVEVSTERRRGRRPRYNEQFYIAHVAQVTEYIRVGMKHANAPISEPEVVCAFAYSLKFLYENFPPRRRADFTAHYGAPYGFYIFFRTGFSLPVDGAPRFYLWAPPEQAPWGIGLTQDGDPPTTGAPTFGPTDPTCPTGVELNLVTGTPRIVPSVPEFVRW